MQPGAQTHLADPAARHARRLESLLHLLRVALGHLQHQAQLLSKQRSKGIHRPLQLRADAAVACGWRWAGGSGLGLKDYS
jgi:hypothetical protein